MIKCLKKLQLWWVAYSAAVGLMIVESFIKRRRMSHENGIVGSGKLRIVDNPAFPEHSFFRKGREFPCRIRHASVSYIDHAQLQVRSGSLKFADSEWESPLDIEMNTGFTSLFWSARNFLEFAADQKYTDSPTTPNAITFYDYYVKYPEGKRSAQEGVRDVPSTFAHLRYHSQTPTLFIGVDGVTRYVKYRLLPEDPNTPEPGIASQARLDRVYDASLAPGETRSPHYLKTEYRQRVAKGPVRYHLQLQLHTAVSGESEEIFNSNKEWDEKSHPWMELAEVVIQRAGTEEEAFFTRLSLGHAPKELAIIPAKDIDDYNSLNYMRVRTTMVKATRVFLLKTLGFHKPLPDHREVPAAPEKIAARG